MKYNVHWSTDAIDTWYRITYNNRYQSLRDHPFDNQDDDPIYVHTILGTGCTRIAPRREW